MNQVLVSIICTAYNHEKYIRDALEGFVKQKTNFNYEVLIHDDASLDKTSDIIREYEKNYPSIIKPIYQKENQYSKGIRITDTLLLLAQGKYIAFCEGDDYWCDNQKLQKQIDFLENHPDFGVCVHNTDFLDCKSGIRETHYEKKDKKIMLEDCIMVGSQSFQTSSVVVKRDLLVNKPAFTGMVKSVGDYPLSIYYSISSNVFYFGEVMSVYRVCSKGSWTERIARNQGKLAATIKDKMLMLNAADKYYGFEYHSAFEKAIRMNNYKLCILQQNYSEAIRIKECYQKERIIKRIAYSLFSLFPFLVKIRDFVKE